MAVQALSVAEVRSRFSDILNRTAYGGQRFIVERHGQPIAVILNMEEYQRFVELEQEKRKRDFALIRQSAKKSGLSEEEASALITEEIEAVRPHA